MARRFYNRRPVTQDDVNKAARDIQAQLDGLNLKVQPNAYGHRIECGHCGWAKSHGTVQGAKDHAATH